MKLKGAISKTGYLPGSPDEDNDFNLIPSNNITMKNMKKPILLIPFNQGGGPGQPVVGMPGMNYKFPNHSMVMEFPVTHAGRNPEPVMDFFNAEEGNLFNKFFQARTGGQPQTQRYNSYYVPYYNFPINPMKAGKKVKMNNRNPFGKNYWGNFNTGGGIPPGYHLMPDGTLMANEDMMYEAGGGVCFDCGGANTGAGFMDPMSRQNTPDLKKGGWLKKASDSMEKRGTKGAFTEYCGGKVTQECIERGLKSSDPTTRKRAGFAKAMRTIATKQFGGSSTTNQENPEEYLQQKNQEFMNFIAQNTMESMVNQETDMMGQGAMPMGIFQAGGSPWMMPYDPTVTGIYPGLGSTQVNWEAPGSVFNVETNQQGQPVSSDPLQSGSSLDMQAEQDYMWPNMSPNNNMSVMTTTLGTDGQMRTTGNIPYGKGKGSVTLSNNRGVRPGTADAILAGTGLLADILEGKDRRKQEEEFQKKLMADNVFTPRPQGISGDRGDYMVNSGMFRPDDMVPVQFRGRTYKKGGAFSQGQEYYLSEQQIQQIIAMGGEVEFID